MLTLLDTHAWVWWVTGDKRLSRSAKRAIERASRRDTLALSFISIWEVAKKVEKRQLVLDRSLTDWLDAAIGRPGLQLIELTRRILEESCRLPQPFRGDPADQMIVATARDRDAVVVSRDRLIRTYPHVRILW
jgi:PIN domain nuclease of toxin-antitoxin system